MSAARDRPTAIMRRQAEAEIDEIAEYIAKDNVSAAHRFYDRVQESITKLAEMPGMGGLRSVKNPALQGLRSWPITGFGNYLIFYLPLPNGGIEVLHVLQGARDFGWIIERG